MEIVRNILLQANKFLLQKPQGGIRILSFHEVKQHQVKAFKELICFLKDRYGFISPVEYDWSNSDKKTSFVISFDDGFSSQVQIAKNILEPLGIKALFFICPQFVNLHEEDTQDFIINKLKRYDVVKMIPEMRPIAWNDVKCLSSHGHVIGAHTMNHTKLSALETEKDLLYEIISSGNELETVLGTKIDWFAYPFGDITSINPLALKIVSSRYRYCCSGLRGINTKHTNNLCMLREFINLDKPIEYLKEVALGGLDSSYYFKKKNLLKMADINI